MVAARKEEEKNIHEQEYCKSESNEAYLLICKNQEEYDKQLLTLSTGMLAVLFAFLKDLVHLDSSICLPILYVGLICLALTIAIVIFSFQLSIRALEKVRNYWKDRYEGNYEQRFPDKLSNSVKYINWAAGVMFIVGISLAVIFILINLSHQRKSNMPVNKATIEENIVKNSAKEITGMANDGALTKQPLIKVPTGKVTSGYVPKVPISTGSKKK